MITLDTSTVKLSGDRFKNYEEVVSAYQERGLTRAQSFRQATIDYPDLHRKWKAENGVGYTAMRQDAARRKREVGYR